MSDDQIEYDGVRAELNAALTTLDAAVAKLNQTPHFDWTAQSELGEKIDDSIMAATLACLRLAQLAPIRRPHPGP